MNIPVTWNWRELKRGDDFPATVISEDSADTVLERVRIAVRTSRGQLVHYMDSDGPGIALLSTAAGNWQFRIELIPAEVTAKFPVGTMRHDVEVTAGGITLTHFEGQWIITPDQTTPVS